MGLFDFFFNRSKQEQDKPVRDKLKDKKYFEKILSIKLGEISFKNAYIVHYKETLDVNNEAPMTIAMTFSAENITVGNSEQQGCYQS